jgi:hypothetical protein
MQRKPSPLPSREQTTTSPAALLMISEASRQGSVSTLLKDVAAYASSRGAQVVWMRADSLTLPIDVQRPNQYEPMPFVAGQRSTVKTNARPLAVESSIERAGEYWTIVYAGIVIRLRDAIGLRHLATLLHHPGRSISARELVASASEPNKLFRPIGDQARRLSHRGALDERARQAVTKAIGNSLERIRASCPELGDHLNATIKRGYSCCYTPDPRVPISWRA